MGDHQSNEDHLLRLLQEHWKTDQFYPLQREAVEATLNGKDVLLILPTSGGKSLTYMLPAVASDKVTVVVSPLLALLKDQVDGALNRYDIEAAAWSSAVSDDKKTQIIRDLVSDDGSLRLLFTTPESLQTPRLLEALSTAHQCGRLCSLAVDEAHCISSWGHDFRESYLRLGDLRAILPGLPVIAVTATATPEVRNSIRENLKLSKDTEILIGSFNRPNISLGVVYKELIGDGSQQAIINAILEMIAANEGDKGIIYCRLRATCDQVAAVLRGEDVEAAAYHAGLDPARRSRVQQDFLNGSLDVVVATVAFGMGIDVSDIRWVVHFDAPSSMDGLYQEIGRAGRDGQPSTHILYSSDAELRKAAKMERGVRSGAVAAVAEYVQGAACRRQALLRHFGERRGACSVENGELLCDFCENPRGVMSRMGKLEDKLAAAHAAASAPVPQPTKGAANDDDDDDDDDENVNASQQQDHEEDEGGSVSIKKSLNPQLRSGAIVSNLGGGNAQQRSVVLPIKRPQFRRAGGLGKIALEVSSEANGSGILKEGGLVVPSGNAGKRRFVPPRRRVETES